MTQKEEDREMLAHDTLFTYLPLPVIAPGA